MSGAILIVDDEEGVRELLKLALRPLDVRVHEASDGDEALDQVREAQPDLVILDLMMPRMHGVEVLRSLRADPETSSLPVMLFSAYALSRAEVRELQIEPWMILRKGDLTIQHLRDTVMLALNGGRA